MLFIVAWNLLIRLQPKKILLYYVCYKTLQIVHFFHGNAGLLEIIVLRLLNKCHRL